MLTAPQPSAPLAASEAEAALGALERDLELSAYEPASIRPPLEWLYRRREAADEMAALTGAFMLSASQDPALSQDMAGRLGRLADGIAGRARPDDGDPTPANPSASSAVRLYSLRNWIESRLRRFEDLPAAVPHDRKEEIRAAI